MSTLELIKDIDRSIEAAAPRQGDVVESLINRANKKKGAKSIDDRDVEVSKKTVDDLVRKSVESASDPGEEEDGGDDGDDGESDIKMLNVPESAIQALLDQAIQKTLATEKSKQEKLQADLEKSKAETAAAQKRTDEERDRLKGLMQLQEKFGFAAGSSGTPNNPQSAGVTLRNLESNNTSGADAYREFSNLVESANCKKVVVNGKYESQRDSRQSDRWFKEHMHKPAFVDAIDKEARKNGLLLGGDEARIEAITARGDVSPMFLETLSSYVRMNHHPAHIWSNFVDMNVELGKRAGETVDVARFAYQTSSTNFTDWDLTGVASLSTGADALLAGKSQITVREYGTGKPGITVNQPIGMAAFVNAISVMDLWPIINENLGYNYRQFETANILYRLYQSTPLRYYNKRSSIATLPSALVAGDIGTCTVSFLRALSAQMATDNIPPWKNGKWCLVLGPNELKQLEDSLDGIKQVITKQSMADMTRIFDQSMGVGDMNYDGYKGDIGDFMIFSTNTVYAGPVAAPAGVKLQETIVGGLKDVNLGYAFGAHAVARGVAQPFNIRVSSNTDFDRSRIVVWNSFEGFAAMDVHESLSPLEVVKQQNRVVELRFTTAAV